MSRKRQRHGESGDPRKRNAADRKADRARWQEQAQTAEIVEITDGPELPGMTLYMVGPVLTVETRLLPGAPESVRQRYLDRIRAVATGRCPRCGEVSGTRELGDGSTIRSEIVHEDDCEVLTLDDELQWFDPRGVSMDGTGIPPALLQRRAPGELEEALRAQAPDVHTRYQSFLDQEKAAVAEMFEQSGLPHSGKTLRVESQLHQRLDNAFAIAVATGSQCPHVDPAHPRPGLMLDHYRNRILCVDCYQASWEPLPGDQEFRCDLCAELVEKVEDFCQVVTHVGHLLATTSLCESCFADVQAQAS